ncbi:cysteine-tryptophan domain-containing zinc finger protein 7-like isoform X1 [Fagus crenata]
MIYVGDARKGLELRFGGGGGGREMEETELEEGEACSYRNDNEEYDPSIDPDVTLSYIDEKLQNVLGHFQKDFEGGVSAENLGAKFGGYGSFLPTYQRSPVWSHPRTSPKVQNYSSARSPNNLLLEGGHHNSSVSSTAPQSVRLGPSSTSSTSLPVLKAPYMKDSIKQDVGMPSICAEEVTHSYEFENKKSTNLSDQKTLKVRIKVGSDNLSTQKNAAIYSGLGLDVSPSSSLNDSPSESEGMSREPQDIPCESPTSILQIMTSFPVLLSPLSHDLTHLAMKEKLKKDYRSIPVIRGGVENSNIVPNGSDSAKVDGTVLEEKKIKSVKRNDISAELKSGNSKDARKGNGFMSRKEHDIDILEDLVSKTMRLPLLSNSNSVVDDITRGKDGVSDILREANNGVLKDKNFSDTAKQETLGPTFTQEDGWFEKLNVGSAGKIWEDKKASSVDDSSVYPKIVAHSNGEKSHDSVKSDSNVSKGRKALNSKLSEPFKEKANQKATAHEPDSIRLPPEKEHPFNGSKKKSKGSQSNGILATEVPKVSLRVGSSMPKVKKSFHVDNNTSKSEVEDFKSQKDFGRAGDRYRDIFGGLEEEDNQMKSLEFPSEDKNFEVVENRITAINNASDERSSGRKFDKLSTSEAYPKAGSNVGRCSGNWPISDAAPGMGAPSVIDRDTWVLCDKCQKWRLLPFGTSPKDLPEKWTCSMLDWLPGMNRCTVTQEETTQALVALYQVPASESQTFLHGNPGGVIAGVTFANVRHPDQNNQNIGLHSMPSSGKKKDGLKETSDATFKDDPSQLSNSMKKNLQASVKGRSLNDVNQSPLMGEPDFQQLSKSSDLPVKKHKEKQTVRDSYSDGGDTKNLKMKSRRDNSDQDCSRASKKMKSEGMLLTEEDRLSDHSGPTEKIGPSSSNGFPTTSSEKDQPRYNGRSSFKDSRDDVNERLHVSVKKPKHKVPVSLDDGSLEMVNSDTSENAKRRKAKEFSENDFRKEKKARVSKSEGKESSTSRDSGRTDKKGSRSKNQQLGQDLGRNLSQRSLDGMDSLRRDLGSLQPSIAATSSSSKVSGPHKTKASFQEVKGSPVESVSSSPMRISNPDKLTSASRDLKGKDDLQDAGLFAPGSPRRCLDGEADDGSDRSGTERKDKKFNVAHHRSLGSTGLDSQDRDFNHVSGSKVRAEIVPSLDITNGHLMNNGVHNLVHDNPDPSKPESSNHCHDEDRQIDSHPRANESRPRKSGKGSSSRSKEKNRSSKTEVEMGKSKIPDSLSDLQDHSHFHEVKPRDGKNQLQEKFGVKSDETENKHVSKKDSAGKLSSESSKRESQLDFGEHDGPRIKVDSTSRQDALSTTKQNHLQDCDGERSSKRFPSDKSDQGGLVSGRGKSLPLPPAGGPQIETLNRCPRPVTGSHKGNRADISAVDASEGDDALKLQKQIRKAEQQNGTQRNSSRHPTLNGQKARERDAPSPARRDSSSQAATNALKEAKDLKHLADRLKNSGSNLESTGLYFEAALKFLHGASLSESGNGESLYSSTAKLCEFCAHEYEKSKDMAAAALAYKCMEVAYMRVIYFSHTSASRDRNELQTALQMIPPGESPSSSASDLDNLNNPTTVDKLTLPKGVGSPQVAGNHVIAARNRPNFSRLLNFAQDVNYAMEASRKSRLAFAAANVSLGETKHGETISSIKRALDFNFQDVEGLLRLVKLAMEAISR